MKKLLCSLLASTLCFTGSLPVFAGSGPASSTSGNEGITGSGAGGRRFSNASRTKVFINIRGQGLILARLLVLIPPTRERDRLINLFYFLITGRFPTRVSSLPDFKEKQSQEFDKDKPEIADAQKDVINQLLSIGLDFEGGRPVRQLVNSLTLMLPFGIDAKPSETIGVAAVDGTKLYQAITSYNYIVENVIAQSQGQGPEAEKAKETLAKMESDVIFQAISTTLKTVREELESTKAN